MMYKHPSADRTMSGFASGKLLLEPTLLLICKSGGTGREEMLCWVSHWTASSLDSAIDVVLPAWYIMSARYLVGSSISRSA